MSFLFKFLAMCLCILSSMAAESIDQFDLFGEGFSSSFDIKIGDLAYEKTSNSIAPQGVFSFSHFKVKSNEMNIFLDNKTHFYDADIYFKENVIGFKGPAAQFAYRLRNEDLKYIQSFKWVKMGELHFLMDKEKIVLNGKSFAMREPRTYFVASDFDLECARNEGYMLNDGDGFLSGCLNDSHAKGLSSIGFGIDYKLFNESGKRVTDFQGYFTEFSATKDYFSTNAFSLTARFKEELIIDSSEVEIGCGKKEDLVSISEEDLLVPCLETVSFQSNFMKLTMLPEEEETSLYKPSLSIKSAYLIGSVDKLFFKNKISNFELNAFGLNCSVLDGDRLLAGTYIKSCLSNGVSSHKEASYFKYVMRDETLDEEMLLSLDGELKSLRFGEEDLLIESENLSLGIDNEIFLDLEGLSWECQKERGLEAFDVPRIFDYCKKGLKVDADVIFLKDYSDRVQPLQGKISPKKIISHEGMVSLELKSVELIDRVDYTQINNMKIDCKMINDKDILKPKDVIASCSENGRITFNTLYSLESKLSISRLLNSRFNFDKVSLGEAKPSVLDADFRVQNQMLSGEVKVEFLGKERSITFSGKVSWDEASEVLTFKLEKSMLPWGIKSKSIFLYALRKMLVTEMITYEEGNILKIAL